MIFQSQLHQRFPFVRIFMLLLIAALFTFFPVSCNSNEAATYEVVIGSRAFNLEVADTDRERQQGLMYRKSLASDGGMIFVFPEEELRSFWMRNTYVNLSIAYLDRNGRIIDILDMMALDESSVPSSRPAMYAIELRQGAFEEVGAYVGDVLDLSAVLNR